MAPTGRRRLTSPSRLCSTWRWEAISLGLLMTARPSQRPWRRITSECLPSWREGVVDLPHSVGRTRPACFLYARTLHQLTTAMLAYTA